MEEYQSNSHKSKEQPEKRVEKAVAVNARTKKRSDLKRFADFFVPEDVSSVKSYILLDVLIPAIKKAISDIVISGINMLLYGETGKKKSGGTASKISYRSFYEGDTDDRRPVRDSRYTDTSIIVDSRSEAEAIVDGLEQIIEVYQYATVADLCDLAGIDHVHTDNKYGWSSVKNARIVRRRDGWEIVMPKRIPLD